MNYLRRAYLLPLLVCIVCLAYSGEPDAATRTLDESEEFGLSFIDEEKLFAHLNFISSDLFEGRGATERGAELMAEYAAALFRSWGLRPGGDLATFAGRTERSYFQHFHVIEYEPLPASSITVSSVRQGTRTERAFGLDVEFRIGYGFSENVSVTAPVAFAGYGMSVPEHRFDELGGVDVSGKIALIMSGVPHAGDSSYVWNQADGRRHANLMQRIRRLREAGAAGVLIATSDIGVEDPLYGEFASNVSHHHPRFARYYEGDEPLTPRRRMKLASRERDEIPVLYVTHKVADAILASSGKTLGGLKREIDERIRPQSRIVAHTTVVLHAEFSSRVLKTNNVLAFLEGSDPGLKDEVVIVGAHYDHDGKRDGYVWNGADDNGSGTAGVLTLAHAFSVAPERPKRSILFALWGAEEKGLLGSNFFVENPVIPLERIVVKKNLDMIGRDADNPQTGGGALENTNRVSVTVSAQMPMLESICRSNNEITGLDMNLRAQNITGGGSDHVPFARKGVPVISVFTGFHPDYHQPSDTVEKINFPKMTRIVRLSYLNLRTIANH